MNRGKMFHHIFNFRKAFLSRDTASRTRENTADWPTCKITFRRSKSFVTSKTHASVLLPYQTLVVHRFLWPNDFKWVKYSVTRIWIGNVLMLIPPHFWNSYIGSTTTTTINATRNICSFLCIMWHPLNSSFRFDYKRSTNRFPASFCCVFEYLIR